LAIIFYIFQSSSSLGWRHEKSHTLMQGVAFFMLYVLVMAGTMQASD